MYLLFNKRIQRFADYNNNCSILIAGSGDKIHCLTTEAIGDCLGMRMGTDQWEAMSQNDKQQKVMILDNQAVEQIQIGVSNC